MAIVIVLAMIGRVAWWVLPWYLLLGVLAYFLYGWDKVAARGGHWRTQESTLNGLAMLGGWPGNWIAQRAWRHKSRKGSFLAAFWLAVVVNPWHRRLWSCRAANYCACCAGISRQMRPGTTATASEEVRSPCPGALALFLPTTCPVCVYPFRFGIGSVRRGGSVRNGEIPSRSSAYPRRTDPLRRTENPRVVTARRVSPAVGPMCRPGSRGRSLWASTA